MPTHPKKCQLFDSMLQIQNYRENSLDNVRIALFILFYVWTVLFGYPVTINDAHDSKMPSFHQFQSCIPYALNVQMKVLINMGVVVRRKWEREWLASPTENWKITYKTARYENIFHASSKKIFSLNKTITIVRKTLFPAAWSEIMHCSFWRRDKKYTEN